MIEHMDDIINSGIDSLKIEGRMKPLSMSQQLPELTARQ